MGDTVPRRKSPLRTSIPAFIVLTSVIAVGVNCYLLFFKETAIFDPLFYIPILLTAYYYPKRGISLSAVFAIIYLLMVMFVPGASHPTALASFGHAGIFVIIGSVVSFLRLRYPQEKVQGIPAELSPKMTAIPFKKPGLVLSLIIISSVIAFLLNFYLLSTNQNLIFDPLFYFPIILIAYFYPHRGILATSAYAILFCLMVLLNEGAFSATFITGFLHAGLFIIIGFLLSYIVLLYSHEQEIHKRLAEIVESSSDAIIGKTLDGIITDWNKGAERLYGYRPEEVTGKSINLIVPPDRPDEIPSLLTKIKTGEQIERYETERVTKDGRRIWISLSISPIRNDAGTIIGASAIEYDITERRLAEDALGRANKKLHLFSSITRHDVLNQLTVLNIYHNLAESMIDDPVALSFLDKAKKAADTIAGQITFTHEYQEIGAKTPVWLDVHTGFANAAVMFKAKQVTILPCKKGIEIFAEPQLEVVFYKLIDHSLTYGAVVTRIRCSCREGPAGLTITYEDNGVGIPVEDKERIFEKTTGDDIRLGLFLIREILSITNITIIENGEPGAGSRFEVLVPRGAYRFTIEHRQGDGEGTSPS